MTTKRKRIVEFVLMDFRDWRLLPWYESGRCRRGCCRHWEFT